MEKEKNRKHSGGERKGKCPYGRPNRGAVLERMASIKAGEVY